MFETVTLIWLLVNSSPIYLTMFDHVWPCLTMYCVYELINWFWNSNTNMVTCEQLPDLFDHVWPCLIMYCVYELINCVLNSNTLMVTLDQLPDSLVLRYDLSCQRGLCINSNLNKLSISCLSRTSVFEHHCHHPFCLWIAMCFLE